MPLFSRARRAGAGRVLRKPSLGLRRDSQTGQVGQSLVLLKVWPLGQVLRGMSDSISLLLFEGIV